MKRDLGKKRWRRCSRKSALLIAGAMLLSLFLSATVPVKPIKAEGEPELKIKYVVTVPDHVTVFTGIPGHVSVTPYSKNGNPNFVSGMPDLGYHAGEYNMVNDDPENFRHRDQDPNTPGTQIIYTSPNLLEGVEWPESGQYTYRISNLELNITEERYGEPTPNPRKAYLVSIFISKVADGKTVVDHIYLQDVSKDTPDSSKKLEYDPDSDNSLLFPFYFQSFSRVFLKKIVKGPNPVNPHDSFGFEIKVTSPAGYIKPVNPGSTRGMITLADTELIDRGKAETSPRYFSAPAPEANQTITLPLELTKLKDQEELEFWVPNGSKVAIREIGSNGYLQSLDHGNENKWDNSMMDYEMISSVEDLANGLYVGDTDPFGGGSNNYIRFVNTQQSPTGVLMQQLPFLIILGIAGMGILLFFIKRRRESEEL